MNRLGEVNDRRIKLDYLTRVEGEASLRLRIDQGVVADLELSVFEPPRFFEALLKGRSALEVPDITARICGICPVAYQLTATIAIENAVGFTVDPTTAALRRVLYAGEWIQSHALHIFMLHVPDFLGFPDVASLAQVHGSWVQKGLAIRRVGCDIMKILGGREIHPINVRVGGFYSPPSRRDLATLAATIDQALATAVDCVNWVAGFDFPDSSRNFLPLAVVPENGYPMFGSALRLGDDDHFVVDEFSSRIKEHQVPYSHALQSHASVNGADQVYLTGPMARFALAKQGLRPLASQLAQDLLPGKAALNPFRSIIVRAIEVVHALEEAKAILAEVDDIDPVKPGPRLQSGDGCAVTEAPRGVLYHRYRLDRSGDVLAATIVPPTSQNQCAMEDDLRQLVNEHIALGDSELGDLCERAIRNYDPCISCAAHFLRLEKIFQPKLEV